MWGQVSVLNLKSLHAQSQVSILNVKSRRLYSISSLHAQSQDSILNVESQRSFSIIGTHGQVSILNLTSPPSTSSIYTLCNMATGLAHV